MTATIPPPPVREYVKMPARSFTKDEMLRDARVFMERTYGKPGDLVVSSSWFERFGLLTAFVMERFPEVKA